MGLSKEPGARRRQLANLSAPPVAPRGNTRAAHHYGRAEVTVPGTEAAREEILTALAAAAPIRDRRGELPEADAAAVELAARALARVRAIDAWLDEHGMFGRGGKLRPAVAYLDQATRTASGLLDRLGMTPRSRAALGVDLARTADLATAMSETDAERRKALLADVLEDPDD